MDEIHTLQHSMQNSNANTLLNMLQTGQIWSVTSFTPVMRPTVIASDPVGRTSFCPSAEVAGGPTELALRELAHLRRCSPQGICGVG